MVNGEDREFPSSQYWLPDPGEKLGVVEQSPLSIGVAICYLPP